MPAGDLKAKWEMCLKNRFMIYSSQKKKSIVTMISLKNAANASLEDFAGAVLRSPMEQAEVFMEQTLNVGRK